MNPLLRFPPVLLALALALPSAALAAPDFAALAPDLEIARLDAPAPVASGEPYDFEVSADSLAVLLTARVKEEARAAGLPEADYSAEVNELSAVDWWLVDPDLAKTEIRPNFPDLVAERGMGTGAGASRLRYAFYLPTDPGEGYMVVARAAFRWNALRNGAPLFPAPVAAESFGKLHLSVLDLSPPSAAKLSPDTLRGFCGGRMHEFNARAGALGVSAVHPANPETLALTFYDDNPAAFDERAGELHAKGKTAAFLLFETCVTRSVGRGRGAPRKGSPLSLYDALGEEPADPKGEGEFVWSDPIPLAEVPGVVYSVERFGPEAGRKRVGMRAEVPLSALEEILAAKSPAHAKLPLRYAALAGESRIHDPSARERTAPHLRFTFAAADSSGNLVVPSERIVPDPAVRAKFAEIHAAINGGRSEPTMGEHDHFGRILPLDAIRPNPVVVVTNTRRGVSGVVTLPNGDLAAEPWGNDEAEWVFSAAGETPAMRALPPPRRAEVADLLTVAEGDRLLFSIAACDNVSRDAVDPASPAGALHGVSTPMCGEGEGMRRYVTWRIEDAGAVAREDFVEEGAGGNEIHRYPDYVFRRAAAGEQSVRFYVTDFSTFRDPAAPPAPDGSPDWFTRVNRRALKLVFKVNPASTTTERMGGSERTKREDEGAGKGPAGDR